MFQPDMVYSVKTIHLTYEALQDLIKEIHEESTKTTDVLDLAREIFQSLGVSTGISLAVVSPLALPIPIAMKAVSLAFSKLIENRTGLSLQSWSSFVSSVKTQFDDYLQQLDKVSKLSENEFGEDESPDDLALKLENHEELLRATRFKTRIWLPVLNKIVQINQLVEAFIEARKSTSAGTQEQPSLPAIESSKPDWKNKLGSFGELASEIAGKAKEYGTVLGDEINRFSVEHKELFEYIAAPITDMKTKTINLRNNIDKLSQSISYFDNLLELQLAQFQAKLGKISPTEVELLEQRVAVLITIPGLHRKADDVEKQISKYQNYLKNLDQPTQIHGDVCTALKEEYRVQVNTLVSTKQKLNDEIQLWATQGKPILNAGVALLENEIEKVNARKFAGEFSEHDAQSRVNVINHEMDLFKNAMQLIGVA